MSERLLRPCRITTGFKLGIIILGSNFQIERRSYEHPILDALKKLERQNGISFHTPGHKGRDTLINWKTIFLT